MSNGKVLSVKDVEEWVQYRGFSETLYGVEFKNIVKLEINHPVEFFEAMNSVYVSSSALTGFPIVYVENDLIVLESSYDSKLQDKIYCKEVFISYEVESEV